MKLGARRIFTSQDQVDQLLRLKAEVDAGDLTMEDVAYFFHCDRTSINYQLKKYANRDKVKTRAFKEKKEHCLVCDMLITSEYHKKYPCYE